LHSRLLQNFIDRRRCLKIEERYPEILQYIKEFISINGESSANERRRDSLEYIGGFTVKELKKYIIKRSQEEGNRTIQISETTLRHFFEPPNKNAKAAAQYKSLFRIKQLGGFFFNNYFSNKNRREYSHKIQRG